MKQTKNIILIIVLILALTALFFAVKPKQEVEVKKKEIATNKDLDKSVEKIQDNNKWEEYRDEKYKYSVEYPSSYYFTPIKEEVMQISESLGRGNFTVNGGIVFTDHPEGMWFFAVHIFENTETSTLEEYIEKIDNQFDYIHVVIDEKNKIDGNEAISYHKKSDYEETPESEKYIIFLKDKILFKIVTRGNDENQKRFINSFKFNK